MLIKQKLNFMYENYEHNNPLQTITTFIKQCFVLNVFAYAYGRLMFNLWLKKCNYN